MSTVVRFTRNDDPDDICAALDRDGVVVVEELLPLDVVDRVNDEVGAAVDAVDPNAELFSPVMSEFYGPYVKQLAGAPGLSRTFATDVMCHPMYLAICDRVLLPSCARYQLNLGHLLQREPGADAQWLHRDEAVWNDMPWPHPELMVASVLAFVDFTRDNGATRVVPGSHRWPDRTWSPAEQMTQPPPDPALVVDVEMPAGSAVIYLGGTIHGGGSNVTDRPRRGAHLSYCLGWLRTEENNYLSSPPEYAATLPRTAQELLGYAMHNNIGRGGGYLGMVRMQDPVELLARGELTPTRGDGLAHAEAD
jgi:ectoine hydroxylase-related dioxygenase (phytanoyl-CoA dioxygenase family)